MIWGLLLRVTILLSLLVLARCLLPLPPTFSPLQLLGWFAFCFISAFVGNSILRRWL